MAAPVEEHTSELDDGRDYGRQDDDDQVFSHASEHLEPSVVHEAMQPTMPDADQPNFHNDAQMYRLPPAANEAYYQDMHDTQGLPHCDGERYEMQGQFSHTLQYQGQEAPAPHEPVPYYEEHIDRSRMAPGMTQDFVTGGSDRAHAMDEFERVAAQDDGGKIRLLWFVRRAC